MTARRAVRAPLRVDDDDVGLAALALREAMLGIAGPAARETPGFGPLLAVGVMGGLALPAVRRATRALRAEEQRVRLRRASRYGAARRGTGPADRREPGYGVTRDGRLVP